MKRKIGNIIIFVGFISLIYTLFNYLNEPSRFELFGINLAISEVTITPVIISAAILLIGFAVWAVGQTHAIEKG